MAWTKQDEDFYQQLSKMSFTGGQPAQQAQPKQNTSALGDAYTAVKAGVQEVPGMVTGLLDIPVAAATGRPMVSEGWDEIGKVTGFRPGQWAKETREQYSPAQQQFLQDGEKTEGFWDTAGHYASNPLRAGVLGLESIPGMVAGGAAARTGALVRAGLGGFTRAGIGEGAVIAGQNMNNMVEEGVDPRRAAGAAAVSGVLGGAIGAGMSRLAGRMGLSDIDVMFAGGGRAVSRAPLGFTRRVAGGAVSEGLLEEAPQSALETLAGNWAAGRPLEEGVGKAAGAGAVIGGMLGGGMNIPGARRPVDLTQDTPAADPTASALRDAIHTETQPTQDWVNQTVGVSSPMGDKARSTYEKEMEAAFAAPSGVRVSDENGIERELTAYEAYVLQTTGELPATPTPPAAEGTPATDAAPAGFGDQFKTAGGTNHKLRTELNNAQSQEEVLEIVRAAAEQKTSTKNFDALDALHKNLTGQTLTEWKTAQEIDTEVAQQIQRRDELNRMTPEQRAAETQRVLDELYPPTQGAANGRETQPVQQASAEGQSPVGQAEPVRQGQSPGAGNADEGQNADDEERRNGQGQEGLLTPGTPPVVAGARPVVDATRSVSITAAPSTALPQVQQEVFDYMLSAARDNRLDAIVDGAGVIQYNNIAKALGKKRGSIKMAVDGAMRNIAKAQGMTVEEFKAALRQRGAQTRETQAPAVESLGMPPSAQEVAINEAEVFGTEEGGGATQSMEIVASPGQTNANPYSAAMDEGNEAGTEFLRQAGALEGRNEVVVPETQDNDVYAERRALEAQATRESQEPVADPEQGFDFSTEKDHRGMAIQPVDVEDAAADYDEDLAEGDLTFAQLSPKLQRQWVKVWLARQDGAVSAQMLARVYGDILDESKKHPAVPQRAAPEGSGLETDQARLPGASEARDDGAVARGEETTDTVTAEAAGLGDGAQFSEGTGGVSDAQTVAQSLRSAFLSPARFDALVTVVQSADQLPRDARGALSGAKGRVQGLTMGGRVYLLADNIPAGQEMAVFLHELGVHVGMKGLLGPTNFSRLVQQIRNWSKPTGTLESRLATKALLRAVRSSSQSDEEVVAYFVEEAINAGVNPSAVNQGSAGFRQWFRSLWAGVKAALRKIGWKRFDKLSAQDVVNIAYGAAHLELHGTWHGTAADFRRFDHNYMNSGEGAQAFGWGTYVAQRVGIAKGYWEADVARKGFDEDAPLTEPATLTAMEKALLNYLRTRATTNSYVDVHRMLAEEIRSGGASAALARSLSDKLLQANPKPGSLMRVVPQVEDDEMLDWDEPIAEQSEKVKAALGARSENGVHYKIETPRGDVWVNLTSDGSDVYTAITDRMASDKAASEYLDSLGIKGIKFLDSQSRTSSGRRTIGGFPQLQELTDQLAGNDFLGFDSRNDALNAAVQDGMVEMRQNFELPPDLDQLLDQFVTWMKSPPENPTRNLVIFNDKNLLRVATQVGAERDRVKYSEASVTDRLLDALPDEARPQVKKAGVTVREAVRTAKELLMFTEDLVRQAKEVMEPDAQGRTSVERWYQELAKREQVRIAHKARIDEIGVEFDKLDRKSFTNTWALIHDMTRSQKWGYQPSWRDAVTVDAGMKGRYDQLSATEQKLLDEVFEHGHKTQREVQKILDDVLAGEKAAALAAARTPEERTRVEKQFAQHEKVFGRKLAALDGPYAPMRRVGNHVVVAKSQAYLDLNGKREQFALRSQPEHYRVEFYDSQAEAEARRDELARSFAEVDAAVKEHVAEQEMLPFEAFDKIRKMIAADGKEGADKASTTVKRLSSLVTELYLSSLAETSARKSELRRDKIGGVEVEEVGPEAMYRAFLSKGTADAHYIGTLKNGREVATAFAQMRIETNRPGGDRHLRRRLFNELSKRYENSLRFDSSPVIGKLLNFSSMWMLLTKPAYFVYNATQPLMLTQPALAQQDGYAKSFAAMMKAYKEVTGLRSFFSAAPVNLHELPADVRNAVIELRDMGRIDITLTQDLGDRIHGATSRVGRGWQWAERQLKGVAQKVEMTNRVVSAIAAYRLARARNVSHEGAVKYASDIIYNTHGDYSNLNAPRAMNATSALRLMSQFRKIQFIQIGQLVRLTREAMKGASAEEKWMLSRALRYTLAHHALAAGAMGLPAASVIAMLYGMSGDDDEPRDLEFDAYKAVGDKDLAELLLHGVPAVFNLNVSRNVGMGQTFSLLPFADIELGERGSYEKVVTAAAGPLIGGFGPQAWDALGAMERGDYYKGIEGLLPSGLRQASKAMREALSGVKNTKGDTLVAADEIDAFATAVKLLGFKTETDAVRQLVRGASYEYDDFFSKRTTTLKNRYSDAYRDNDAAEMADVRADWAEMQEYRKLAGFKPQPLSTLLKAPREREKRERNTANGVQYNRGNRAFVLESMEDATM